MFLRLGVEVAGVDLEIPGAKRPLLGLRVAFQLLFVVWTLTGRTVENTLRRRSNQEHKGRTRAQGRTAIVQHVVNARFRVIVGFRKQITQFSGRLVAFFHPEYLVF